jgi:putative hemolysin
VTVSLIALFALFVFWGFFAGTETAFITANKFRLNNMKKKGKKSAVIAHFLLEKPERLFTTTLVGTNISLVLAANLTSMLFFNLFKTSVPIFSIVVLTFFSLIFCEIIPKNLAIKHSMQFTLIASYPIFVCFIIFYPVGKIFSYVSHFFIRIFDVTHTGKIPQMFKKKEDVKIFLSSQLKKRLKTETRRYFVDSLDFGKKELSEIMIPLVEIEALAEDKRVEDCYTFIRTYRKSYVPVFEDRIDNIVGIIYVNDLFDHDKKEKIGKIMKEALYVPENKNINDLYRELFVKDVPVVFAVDEYGGVTGLATIYDIGEEIIGEISGFGAKKDLLVKIKRDEYLCAGDIEIDEINHRLDLDIEAEDVVTLNGLFLKKLGRIPESGDHIDVSGYRFIVEMSSEKKVDFVRIIPKT